MKGKHARHLKAAAPLADDELTRAPSPHKLARPLGPFARFLMPRGVPSAGEKHEAYPWYGVLWLTGVDYFSSLGYAPAMLALARAYATGLGAGQNVQEAAIWYRAAAEAGSMPFAGDSRSHPL